MRYYTARAFRKLPADNALMKERGAVDKAIPALLKQAAVYEPEKDPLRKLHVVIANTLFYGGSVRGCKGLSPEGKGVENVGQNIEEYPPSWQLDLGHIGLVHLRKNKKNSV